MSHSTYTDSVLRQRWDDAARTYTEFDAAGVKVTSRAFTAEENAAADAQIAAAAEAAALEALRVAVRAIIVDAKTERDNLDANVSSIANTTINASPARYIKDTATATRRTLNAVIDLARLVKDV